jgi:hypothetical protein
MLGKLRTDTVPEGNRRTYIRPEFAPDQSFVVKKLVFLTIALASLLVLPAFAVGLTEADYDYLATQDVKRGSPVLNALSPKEQSRLHALINDPGIDKDPLARAKMVRDALIEFEGNQDWEKMNPGQLWDVPKSGIGSRRRD